LIGQRKAAGGKWQDRAVSLINPGVVVANRTYRLTEIVGTSTESMEDAVRNGISRASETVRHLDWFEVTEVRGQIDGSNVRHWQVSLKVGFRLEDS
jgi:flavin-binding protein dodecin